MLCKLYYCEEITHANSTPNWDTYNHILTAYSTLGTSATLLQQVALALIAPLSPTSKISFLVFFCLVARVALCHTHLTKIQLVLAMSYEPF